MNDNEIQELIDKEVKGSESAVQKMLLYYASALLSNGVDDVKQYIATKICDMIELSEEQSKFVLANFNQKGKLVENLENSIKLLKKIEENKELDLESITIVRKVLELILKDYDAL